MAQWCQFRAQAMGAAEIVIYDEIGAFAVPAQAFLDELKVLGPVAELTVRINSPGGSVFDGVAIYNALKRHDAAITVWVDGIAAPIPRSPPPTSFIWMAPSCARARRAARSSMPASSSRSTAAG